MTILQEPKNNYFNNSEIKRIIGYNSNSNRVDEFLSRLRNSGGIQNLIEKLHSLRWKEHVKVKDAVFEGLATFYTSQRFDTYSNDLYNVIVKYSFTPLLFYLSGSALDELRDNTARSIARLSFEKMNCLTQSECDKVLIKASNLKDDNLDQMGKYKHFFETYLEEQIETMLSKTYGDIREVDNTLINEGSLLLEKLSTTNPDTRREIFLRLHEQNELPEEYFQELLELLDPIESYNLLESNGRKEEGLEFLINQGITSGRDVTNLNFLLNALILNGRLEAAQTIAISYITERLPDLVNYRKNIFGSGKDSSSPFSQFKLLEYAHKVDDLSRISDLCEINKKDSVLYGRIKEEQKFADYFIAAEMLGISNNPCLIPEKEAKLLTAESKIKKIYPWFYEKYRAAVLFKTGAMKQAIEYIDLFDERNRINYLELAFSYFEQKRDFSFASFKAGILAVKYPGQAAKWKKKQELYRHLQDLF